MSKLDDLLLEERRRYARFPEAVEPFDVSKSKQEVKKLFLDLFKEAEYDPWAFVDKVEKL